MLVKLIEKSETDFFFTLDAEPTLSCWGRVYAGDDPMLIGFLADQTLVAFYGVATLSQTTLSPILGFIASI